MLVENLYSRVSVTSPGEGFELGVVLGVEEGAVVRVLEVLVDVLSVLLEASLEPVPGPLQGMLDLNTAGNKHNKTSVRHRHQHRREEPTAKEQIKGRHTDRSDTQKRHAERSECGSDVVYVVY